MIAITGISGYIGFHLASFLKQQNQKIIGIIKENTSDKDISLLNSESIKYSLANLSDENAVYKALSGADTVVHLIGSIYKPKSMGLDELHKDITAVLVRAAKRAGVTKIIYVSALGSELSAKSDYHRTKSLAEDEIKKSGIKYVILQPSLVFGKIYGIRNSKLIARLAQSITNLPFIPTIGKGTNKLQPIFIMDLVRCIYESINDKIENVTIELGGPKKMEFKEIAQLIAKSINKDNKPLLNIPIPLAGVLASIMEKISGQPKITKDQVKMVGKDNVCQSNLMDKYFNFTKKSMDELIDKLL